MPCNLWILVWAILVLRDSNPVPIPGTAQDAAAPDRFQMTQRLLTDFAGFSNVSCEGEGCRGPTTTAEADKWQSILHDASANSGQPPPVCGNTRCHPSPYTSVQKRSYKRACRRALSHGYADYHGKRMHLSDFPSSLVKTIQVADQTSHKGPLPLPGKPSSSPRINIMYWNSGGLSQARFLEIKHWLQVHPVDLVILAETKWNFSSTWEDSKWSYLHSSTDINRSGGLLVMVARSFAHPDQLGYDWVVPGRLMHVRIHGPTRALDVVAVYQYADYRDAYTIQQREQIWTAMDDCFRAIPRRNNFVCAGDFNCDLQMQPPWVGSTMFHWRNHRIAGSHHSDQRRFQALLRAHGLTALNTWGKSGATFVHGPHASRIDHILTRLISSDGVSKNVQYHDQADFAPFNQSHHLPLTCSISKHHMSYQRYTTLTKCSFAQRNQCRIASLEETRNWVQLRQQVIDVVTAAPAEADPGDFIARIHQEVSTAFHTLFPHKAMRFPQLDLGEFHQSTEDKWHHRRKLKELQQAGYPSMRSILQAWFHRCRYGILQRQQQRQARQARQHRFQLLCQEVDTAARHHDSHAMFSIINRFSPKRPQARARLKGPDGKIADQHLAHAMTVAFVKQMWAGPNTLPTYSDSPLGVPFDLETLTCAITQMNANKSVAQPFLPAIVWKSAPAPTAAALYGQLQQWWGQYPPLIPQSWKGSWLHFIPKPGKPNTHPSQMRPISLMEPLGKLVLGLIAAQIKIVLGPILTSFPHFGFMQHRGAVDAIQRVAGHSRAIRALVGTQRRSVIQQMTQRPMHTDIGERTGCTEPHKP